MSLQVVAFQATLELMAQQFPGAFTGYKLEVTESHQRQKADTSGTAKAVIGSIAKLGAPISEVRRAPLIYACSAIESPSLGARQRKLLWMLSLALHVLPCGCKCLGSQLSAGRQLWQ